MLLSVLLLPGLSFVCSLLLSNFFVLLLAFFLLDRACSLLIFLPSTWVPDGWWGEATAVVYSEDTLSSFNT